jgi:small GTP-binding protein
MRGDGESQLEVDRRRIQDRIAKLRRDLKEVKRVRQTQRQGRQRSQWPLASIVGYTNAGKSTLLNALTGAEVLAEDKLFATLDPTTRRITLPTNQNALLSDTVGFIRKLPHQLVESFKATLEEVVEADLLLHVVDVASESAADQIASVNEVLKEIAADDKPTLMVFNKIDKLPERNGNLHWLREYPHAVCVSAKTGEGLDELQAELGIMLRPVRTCLELQVPASDGATLARIRALGQVDEERYEGDIVHLKARIPDHARAEFARFQRASRICPTANARESDWPSWAPMRFRMLNSSPSFYALASKENPPWMSARNSFANSEHSVRYPKRRWRSCKRSKASAATRRSRCKAPSPSPAEWLRKFEKPRPCSTRRNPLPIFCARNAAPTRSNIFMPSS